jgi:hypothetical protein
MSDRDWKQEYHRVVAAEPTPRTRRHECAEQRVHPRLQPAGVSCWFGVSPGMHLIDIDAEGLEFYSNVALAPGQHLRVQVGDAPPLETEVLAWQLEESDFLWLEVRYRVRCRILPAKSA